jgi:3-phenylpropionate/trans-cinnamate dioxygenase ferredoxin reductase subunit
MARCLADSETGFVAQLHRASGTRLRFSAGIVSIEGPDRQGSYRVGLSDGSEERGDCIIAGVGVVRNVDIARSAGLAIEGGCTVDEYGRTSDPDIFAAGDVAALWHPFYGRRIILESWHHARDHGTAVGRNMAGRGEAYAHIPRFWTDQHKTNIQVAGLPGDAVDTVLRGSRDAGTYVALHLDSEGQIVAATVVNAGREMRPILALIQARARPARARLADEAAPFTAMLASPR